MSTHIAADAISKMPDRTHNDYLNIIERHASEIEGLANQLGNDMTGMAGSNTDVYHMAVQTTQACGALRIVARDLRANAKLLRAFYPETPAKGDGQ